MGATLCLLPWAVCDSARGLACLLVLLAANPRYHILPIVGSVVWIGHNLGCVRIWLQGFLRRSETIHSGIGWCIRHGGR